MAELIKAMVDGGISEEEATAYAELIIEAEYNNALANGYAKDL